MSEEQTPPKNLSQKLVEIMAVIQRIEKKGWNDFHKYKYLREEDLVESLRAEFVSRGIILIPSVRGYKHDIRLKADGKVEGILTTVEMTFKFIDSDTGQTESFDWAGTGDDKGDKGLYKAYTGAEKYFLMKTFLVPTGDDPEGDAKTDQRANYANDPDLTKAIKKIWEESGGTPEQLDTWVKKNNNGSALDDLKSDRQQAMLTVLESKKAEKEASAASSDPVTPPEDKSKGK
jgi:hypothetical protein